MDLERLLLFAAKEFVLCLSPGPAVLAVIAIAMRRGTTAAVPVSAGVVAGTFTYFTLSAFGVGAIITASHTLFLALKWAGAAYLVWLGLRSAWPLIASLARVRRPGPANAPPRRDPVKGEGWRSFAHGSRCSSPIPGP